MITPRKFARLTPSARLRKLRTLLRTWRTLSPPEWETVRPMVRDILSFVARDEEAPAPLRETCAGLLPYLPQTTDPEALARPFLRAEIFLDELLGTWTADWDLSPEPRGELPPRTSLPIWVYLEDLRSPYNVGAIFRSAEAFGASGIYLSPATPTPDHPRAARTARGTQHLLPWRRLAPDQVGSLGLPVIVLETRGTPVDEYTFPEQGIVVVGNEELGVSPELLALAESSQGRVSIPLVGTKGSLNVSVAAGILLCYWSRALTRRA
ncbi:tRNA/rRNA methyltransferase (SpoU) [Spirochaeta thermophila DSM 6578]|uniref:tRNA/rRNA methyltransferase (SpoU) n=1 Tax=Winmispira thermophila (strain ATCC 700085 / DSM 6578 / Z-1203) TaxID=869211 RepID=G0GC74_WINT7|nr:TrmH family RNA methyltransferase [Spirochaeta thermophila]AEJ60438.1 tRNA/rRNA methyltransferase (SpoU) [Spirochaeta thermophila DSM 6578]